MGLSHAYGAPTEKNEAIRLLHQAVDLGYTFFDTAEVYGTADDPHINEEIVREALRSYKDKVVIATKFGIRFDKECGTYPYPLIADARPESIRKSVEVSLKQLGIECIDLYYQHRIDPNIPPEDVAGVMYELIKEGKIKRWGISETGEEYLRRAHVVCPVTAVENRYSMMYRDYEPLFPTLEELGIAFVAFSPMAIESSSQNQRCKRKFCMAAFRFPGHSRHHFEQTLCNFCLCSESGRWQQSYCIW